MTEIPKSTSSWFELAVEGTAPFEVASFHGREALSRPFSFDVVTLVAPDGELDRSLLGKRATLRFRSVGRSVHGIVAAVRPDTHVTRGPRRSGMIRLVPRLWLAKHHVTCRAFQDR